MEGPPRASASWNPGTLTCGPVPALCSPSNPAMPYLPPLQPGQEHPGLAPGPRKSRRARDQRTRGGGRGLTPGRSQSGSGRRTARAFRSSQSGGGGGQREGGDSGACRVHPAAAGGSRGLRSWGRRSQGCRRLGWFPRFPRAGQGWAPRCPRVGVGTWGRRRGPSPSPFWLEPRPGVTPRASPDPSRQDPAPGPQGLHRCLLTGSWAVLSG